MTNYRYGFKPKKKRPWLAPLAMLVLLALLAAGGLYLYNDIRSAESPAVQGRSNSVAQVANDSLRKTLIEEPYFSMELPKDWKEVDRKHTSSERSISWQATRKGEDNRYLTVYIDTIPTIPVNRLLPLSVEGQQLVVGTLSDNCASFTGGGTFKIKEAVNLAPAKAKWQGVDFICNLPRVIDNQIGTGSAEGGASVIVSGQKGTHKYFFLYTDRNYQPKHNIFYEALTSFEAR